jgi:outer membrane protein OmpA-like peptidoglycan-associated protein
MKIKTLLLCSAITLCLGATAVHAGTVNSGPRYVPRAEISEKNYTPALRMEDHSDRETYQAYEEREPCQNYRAEPRNYDANCLIKDEEQLVVAAVEKTVTETRLPPIIRSYTILFDHDKSHVRADENATMNQIAQEINKYNPSQVTVTGYTDSSGNAGYNQTLSREREQAVSAALMNKGIENQTLERDARGEYDQAVETADGTRNQENRRVVVDFRR